MVDNMLRTNFAELMFFVRERYWCHAERLCSATVSAADDPLFRVWRGFCLVQQNLPNEGLKEYKSASEKRGPGQLPAFMGLYLLYKSNNDAAGLAQAELKLSDDKYADDVDGWVQAALLCYASDDINRARDILMKYQDATLLATHRNEYTNLACARAWIDLSSGRSALLEKSGTLFQKAMDLEKKEENFGSVDPNAALGRVAYLEVKYQFAPAQDLLNNVIVGHPNFLPALVVKARLQMRAEDWEQSLDTVRRLLSKDKDNAQAITLQALHTLVKESRPAAASSYLTTLFQVLTEKEARNAGLMFVTAQTFARLSGQGDLVLLNATQRFADFACTLNGRSGEYLCEVGMEQSYRGDYKTALTTFKKATALTETLTPLLGSAMCHLKLGKFEEAQKQVNFCNELQPANQKSAMLSLLNAMLIWRTTKNQGKTLTRLEQAVEAMRSEINAVTVDSSGGLELYRRLNAPLMVEIANEIMQHARNEPPDPSYRQPDPIAERCRKHLELLVRHFPGCMQAQLLLSKIHFVSGDLNKAQSIIKGLLATEQPLPDAYLLSAQICQYMGNIKLANQALEQALTLNFEIKDQPYYNLLLGVVQGMMGKTQQALDSLTHCREIVERSDQVTEKGRPLQPLSVPDHVTLYLQLAQAHLRLRDADEARKILTEAQAKFEKTVQAGRVAIAHAMLAARTDVDRAIELLREVPAASPYFIPARTQMAKLFLMQKQNPFKYTECFEAMVKESPTAESFIQLGEAYSTIQEPEKSIAAYEKARALAPNNAELAVRIGRALVSTHEYEKAMRYYQDALANDENLPSVRADLAILCWRLGQVDKAIDTLTESPVMRQLPPTGESGSGGSGSNATATEDTAQSIDRVNCCLLMYKIHKGCGNMSEAFAALSKARPYQLFVINSKLKGESRETVLQQRRVMSSILVELGRYHEAQEQRYTQARDCYNEALTYDEDSQPTLLALAQVHLLMDDDVGTGANMDKCEEYCNRVLKMDPGCEEAVILLANLMTRRGRLDDASGHFQQILRNKPDNYEALVLYIQILRRAGKLEEAQGVLASAAAVLGETQRAPPGLHYARGLVQRYLNNNIEALKFLNLARVPSDNPWANRALVAMVNIYLCPYPTTDIYSAGSNTVTDTNNNKLNNIRCAEQLLLMLPNGDERRILRAFCLLSTKHTQQCEQGMSIFLSLALGEGGAAAAASRNSGQTTSEERKQAAERQRTKGEEKKKKKKGRGDDEDEEEENEDEDEDDKLLREAEAVTQKAMQGGTTLAAVFQSTSINIPALFGLAVALMQLGQGPAARNVIRKLLARNSQPSTSEKPAVIDTVSADRAEKKKAAAAEGGGDDDEDTGPSSAAASPTTPAVPLVVPRTTAAEEVLHFDYVERAMLLSARLDLKAQNYTAAEATLKSAIERNRSSAAAWDALGTVYERQQMHQEASNCYKEAWKLVREGDPGVGYKLAFNYVKGENYVKAIDVCRSVFQTNPNYPKMEQEVMEVAYAMLRP